MSLDALLKEEQQDRESWRYTSLDSYADLPFASLSAGQTPELPAPLSSARLVFLNGRYQKDLSMLPQSDERFFVQDESGLCWIDVGQKTCLALQPLEILFINTGAAAPWESDTGLRLALGANSRLTVIERHMNSRVALYAQMPQIEIVLAEQAKLVHGKIVHGGGEELHAAKTRVTVASGGFYDRFTLLTDGGTTRTETNVYLTGPLAGTRLTGVALLRGASHADCVARVFHQAPHTTSRQNFRAVLDEKAHSVFQGKIHVAPEAQKTDGYQLSRGLLLSDKAEMDAKPELEIFADDVKCTHGSAIGDLSEEAIFYLRARGIGEREARALLIEAFIRAELETLQSPEIQAAAREGVERWLKQF